MAFKPKHKKVKLEALSDQLAAEFGIGKEEAFRAITSQFRFLRDHMETTEFKTIMLPYLGKFHVTKGKKYFFREGKLGNSKAYIAYKEKARLIREARKAAKMAELANTIQHESARGDI